MLGNTQERYGVATRLLHWGIGLVMLALVWLGWWMVGLDYYSPWYNTAPEWHEGVGIAVWLLALVFAVGHLVNRPPAPLPLRPWERIGAWLVHKLLYLAMLVLPVAGYLISTADGNPLDVFGIVKLPALTRDATVRDVATAVHTYGGYGLLGLVAIHAGAALKHHFVNRDRTLLRMLLGR